MCRLFIGPFRAAIVVTTTASAVIVSWPESDVLAVGNERKKIFDAKESLNRDDARLMKNMYALGYC